MTTFITRLLAAIMTILLSSCREGQQQNQSETTSQTNTTEDTRTIFVGTYTRKEGHVDGQAEGIFTVYQNPETGELQSGDTVAQVTNPSFVKASEDGNRLLAVSELGSGDAPSGYIYSYKILENDSLEQISKISTESFAPAHIELDQTGSYVFVSNYMGGVVMMYRLNNDGSLEKQQRVDLENPEQSHAHSVTVSVDNKRAYVADLGNDKIWIFDLDSAEGKLTPNTQASVRLEEGAGPRHFTLSEDGDYAYSINELNSSVSVFVVQEEGGLEMIQNISSLPENYSEENSGADIHIHPSGKFVYVSNRGHNSIASFVIDRNSGKLKVLGYTSAQGKTPRNFAISPEGNHLYVANQDSNSIAILEIDEKTGELTSRGQPFEAMTPVCIEFTE